MNKILIFGPSGAGKSTFATKLGKEQGIPVLHIDEICKKADWSRIPDEEVNEKILEFMKQDSWIIDGEYKRYSHKERLEACDTIIYMQISTLRSLYRVLYRQVMEAIGKESRIGVPEGSSNTIRWTYLKWLVWTYPRHQKNEMLDELQQYYAEKLQIH